MEKLPEKNILTTVEDFYPMVTPIINELAKKGEICFDTLETKPVPNTWAPKDENFQYGLLVESMESDPDYAVETSEKIASDYQKVIEKFIEENGTDQLESLLEGGKKWTLDSLRKWGGKIIESGQIKDFDVNDLVQLEKEIRGKIKEKGKEIFGYAEGNVIGDHIFIKKGEEKKIYLAGMRIVPRIGRGYYDFVRALDWMFLKTPSSEKQFEKIVGYMKKYAERKGVDWEEMKLVAATRFIGIGWDMFARGENKGDRDLGAGDAEEKKKYLLKFIKREY